VLENVPDWRAAVSKRDFTKSASKIRMAKSATIIKPTAPSSVPNSNPPAKIDEPARFVWKTEWTYWAAGAAVVLLVLACLGIELMTNRPEVVQARSQPAPEKTVAKLVPVQPTTPLSIPNPAPLLAPVTSSNSMKVTAAPSVVAKPVPKESGFTTIKLQGIFFSANHPSAIINGQRVEPNDRVGDVLVRDITSSTVTLEYQKQRKTFVLE
jgi:hypothetical protein